MTNQTQVGHWISQNVWPWTLAVPFLHIEPLLKLSTFRLKYEQMTKPYRCHTTLPLWLQHLPIDRNRFMFSCFCIEQDINEWNAKQGRHNLHTCISTMTAIIVKDNVVKEVDDWRGSSCHQHQCPAFQTSPLCSIGLIPRGVMKTWLQIDSESLQAWKCYPLQLRARAAGHPHTEMLFRFTFK